MKSPSLIFILMLTLVAGSAAQKQPSSGSAPQTVKAPPQAKTQAEFKDYNVAYATTGGSQMEAAANAFAAKYPDSELRVYLYNKAMHEYQTENNPEKILAMSEKVLTLDPDNTISLVMTATVLSDQLSDTTPDPEKIAVIKKNAARALETVETMAPVAGATPQQNAAYKDTLRVMAHSALGITSLKSGDNAAAEQELKAATNAGQAPPDAYVWYHLALAQDHQKKYTEALASVEQALHYIGSNAELGKLAAGERDRLRQLTGTAVLPSPNAGPQAQPSPAPPPL
ncbi:MAG TPA: hypothetical protein VKL40_09630 [Candidatus Angelobacter sp.]|nr:hypothetical protein [Candidatus Angelobacter sp.]